MKYIFVICLFLVSFIPADAYLSIPPTKAFNMINGSGGNVTAGSSSGFAEFIAGSGVTIGFDYTLNQITFSAAGSISSIHQIGNVTSTGCAENQILKVNSTGQFACASDSTGAGGEINTMSSPTHAESLVLTKSVFDLPIKGIACTGSATCTGNTTDVTIDVSVGSVNPVVVIKSANETITSDSTFSNDSELFFTADANTMYRAEFMIIFQSGTVADMKYGFDLPSGNFTRLSGTWTSNTNPFPNTSSTPQSMVTSGSQQAMMIPVLFQIGSTGGQVSFEWAQLTLDVGPTTVAKGSSMVVFSAT